LQATIDVPAITAMAAMVKNLFFIYLLI